MPLRVLLRKFNMPKYIKQLTRENTLLDRAFRTIAYAKSLPEIGRAKIKKSPIVGFGRVTSLYYDPVDYKKQQSIIMKEFSGQNIKVMSYEIIKYLEKGYIWAKKVSNNRLTKADLIDLIKDFNYCHAHARGAIVYGYWGEPVITKLLKNSLKVKKDKLDEIVSVLSTPHKIAGPLNKLHKTSSFLYQKRNELIKSLKLTGRQNELVEILSWFTLFYEMGERVSGSIYSLLLKKINQILKKDKIYKDIDWYDPQSLITYLSKGKALSKKELSSRKVCYILFVKKDGLRVISGQSALRQYNKIFKEKFNTNVSLLKGTVACAGNAKGKIKIVITKQDQAKFKPGDILISTMTTPNLMGAVKKAAAIVTDEGGMTAHAAIISRELNIPCLVGTKVATKVFKDGDLVEVDANNGIIKKI